MSCRWWVEIDNAEWCGGSEHRCYCAGTREQCSYPSFYNVRKYKLAALRKKERIERDCAYIDPFINKRK
jgi:hypothetical protein